MMGALCNHPYLKYWRINVLLEFSIDEISIVNFIHFQVKTFRPVVILCWHHVTTEMTFRNWYNCSTVVHNISTGVVDEIDHKIISDFHPPSTVTPVAGQIFETKNRAIFLVKFFGKGISGEALLPLQLCSH